MNFNRSQSYLENVNNSNNSENTDDTIKNKPTIKECQKMSGVLHHIYTLSYMKKSKKEIQKDCKNMSKYIENIYIILFFFGFIIYCIIMFSQVPN